MVLSIFKRWNILKYLKNIFFSVPSKELLKDTENNWKLTVSWASQGAAVVVVVSVRASKIFSLIEA